MTNIYKKLLEVKKQIGYIQQKGKVNFGNTKYTFAGSEDVLKIINPVLNDQGLFIETEIIDQQIENTGKQYFTKLHILFTIVNVDNPDEKITKNWYGQGLDNSEKGIGKALTYAERYFLLKTFNIPTGQDDPELHDQNNYKQNSKPAGTKTEQKPAKVDPYELKKTYDQWFNGCKNKADIEKTIQHFFKKYPELMQNKDFSDMVLDTKERLNIND